MLTFKKDPSRDELNQLGYCLRDEDRREVFASTGEDGVTSLHRAWAHSTEPYLFFWNDIPAWACGTAPLAETIGAPWMLAGNIWEEIPSKLIMRLSHHFIERWMSEYSMLTNYVDVRNAVSRRWLKRIGFTEKEEIPFGHSQRPFIRFEKTHV